MKIAVVMNPLDHLDPKKDTTLALIESAIRRGDSVRSFTPSDWFIDQGKAYAHTRSLLPPKRHQDRWQYAEDQQVDCLTDYDVVLMRQDPPVDSQYLYITYLLSLIEDQGVFVSNRPQSVRDMNEKMGILHFPEWIPPTLVSLNQTQLYQFWEQHHDVVFKPMYGMGGKSVFHVGKAGENLRVILEVLTEFGTRTIMAQRYIPAIRSQGDKRILMIHGEPIPFALARIPAADDFRGNLAAGATGKVVPLTQRDQAICQAVSPVLKEKGLHFVGLDVIGDWLTEINVTSPTCLREIEAVADVKIADLYWEGIDTTAIAFKRSI